jgi:hypothetical protein
MRHHRGESSSAGGRRHKSPILSLGLLTIAGFLAAHLPAGGAPSTAPSTSPATTNPTTAPTSPAIENALQRLGSPDWRVRERGVAELAWLGEAVEPRVREFYVSTRDGEARDRALLILSKLEALRRLQPTRVTLHLKNATPQVAFESLSRQGHILIRPRADDLFTSRDFAPLTLDLINVPFWEALRAVCAETKLKPFYDGKDGDALVLQPDYPGDMTRPHATSGAITVMLSSLQRKFPDSPQDKISDAPIAMSFYIDPMWRVLEYPAQIELHGSDAANHPLPAGEPLIIQSFQERSPFWLMRGALHGVPLNSKHVNVHGEFKLTVVELSPPTVITDVLHSEGKVSRAGRQSLQLLSISKQQNAYIVRCVVTRAGLSQQTWRDNMEEQGIQLLDEQNHPLPRLQLRNQESPEQMTYELSFDCSSKPDARITNLVWHIPLEPRELDVAFNLNSLPMDGDGK